MRPDAKKCGQCGAAVEGARRAKTAIDNKYFRVRRRFRRDPLTLKLKLVDTIVDIKDQEVCVCMCVCLCAELALGAACSRVESGPQRFSLALTLLPFPRARLTTAGQRDPKRLPRHQHVAPKCDQVLALDRDAALGVARPAQHERAVWLSWDGWHSETSGVSL